MLSISVVELDIENPRIARILEMYPNPSPDQIHLALGINDSPVDGDPIGTTFYSLQQSIRTHGSIIHPVIVNRETSGKLVVIEGNTRLAIYKRFAEEEPGPKWEKIPAMVFDGLDSADIEAIRLQAHLVGPRAWDPYSKAKYLHRLRTEQHLSWSQVVDFCGGKQREAQEYVNAYQDMEKYYRPILDSDADFDQTRFSAFVELQKPRVKQAVIGAGFNLSDFAKWVDQKQIHPLNTVRKLPQILANEKSKEVFLLKNAEAAIKVLDAPMPSATGNQISADISLDQLLRELNRRLRSILWEDVKRYKSAPDSAETQAIFEARDELVSLCTEVTPNE
jgi:hypothetical protein